jgi:hypothetical protein
MNIEIKHESNVTLSNISKYVTDQKNSIVDYLVSLGHSKELALSLLKFDESDTSVIWLETDTKPFAVSCFTIKGKMAVVYFTSCNMHEHENLIYAELEKFLKSQKCTHIKQIVSLKDIAIIDKLKSKGFNQEFINLFKKV